MARPTKNVVDYFPHYVKGGRTLFILETKYGNDGYAFWFKLLELLGETDGHRLDCANATVWEFLLAKTHVDNDKAQDIIETLLTLGKIDEELWKIGKVIWVQNFVDNIAPVYKIRREEAPSKPSIQTEKRKPTNVSDTNNSEGSEFTNEETDIVKYSKVKKSKEEKSIEYPYADIADLWNKTCGGILPRVAKLNDNRRTKIKLRLSESGAQTSEDMKQWAQDLFTKIIASDFLLGKNSHQWTATFDWVFENATNWVKVTEGNYDNDRGAQKSRTGVQNNLGVGEYITEDGRRTYGSGAANIPMSAPRRPSERYQWDAQTQNWIML